MINVPQCNGHIAMSEEWAGGSDSPVTLTVRAHRSESERPVCRDARQGMNTSCMACFNAGAQGKKNPELVRSAEGPHSREHLQKADGMQPVQPMLPVSGCFEGPVWRTHFPLV